MTFDPGRLERLDRHLARYVDDGRLVGWQIGISRGPQVVHEARYGYRDREAGLPVLPDTLWRLYSMTKPITSVAAMSLWEEGAFELTDPISQWLPEFSSPRVYVEGDAARPVTSTADEPIRVWHLLSQTSGLSAGFIRATVVDELYRNAGYDWFRPAGRSLADCCRDWAALPLLFHPGEKWGYGVSTDVLGRVLEVMTGQTLERIVHERVTGPLGMTDTVWHVDPSRASRTAMVYEVGAGGGSAVRSEHIAARVHQPPELFSGGGGLLSTLGDYLRFTRMLAGGGELDGVHVLAPRTIEIMTANHLPGDLATLCTGGFAETTFDGVGFGLGFATVIDPVPGRTAASRGEFYWGGAASTAFWVDPGLKMSVVFMTQLRPSSAYRLRPQLRQLVHSALLRAAE